jgi:hypothetical protein
VIERENVTFYCPLVTSIIVSLVLSAALWFFTKWRRPRIIPLAAGITIRAACYAHLLINRARGKVQSK